MELLPTRDCEAGYGPVGGGGGVIYSKNLLFNFDHKVEGR